MRRIPMPRPAALGLAAALLLAAPAGARPADPEVEEVAAALRRGATDPFGQDERERAVRRLGRLGGRHAAAALLPLFEDPFVHLRDHAVGAWTAMLRGGRAAETRSWLVAKALRHRQAAVRLGAARALGEAADPEAEEALRVRLGREGDDEVRSALARAWVRAGGRDGDAAARLLGGDDGGAILALVDALLESPRPGPGGRSPSDGLLQALASADLLGHEDPLARAAAVLALHAAGRLSAARLETVLRDPAEEPRIALAETLAWHGATGSGAEALPLLLADSSWRVRAVAVDAALARGGPEAVSLLLERLAVEEGRLRLDVAQALATLTGKDLGLDVEMWRAWWAAQREAARLGGEPEGGGAGRDGAAAASGAGAGETRTAAFFRLPVLSRRVAFLLDCSGSMRDAAVGADEEVTKMQVARDEVARTLGDLDERTRFDVFLYRYPSTFPPSPRMTRALARLAPCTPANVRRATSWLAREEARGWGAFYDALVLLAEDPEVDTVYFLSDGRPSRGRYDRDFRLLEEFARANRFRRVVVHTVLTGTKGADRRFLESLAALTGGRFSDATKGRAEGADD